MEKKLNCSIVIPTYNMAPSVVELVLTLEQSGVLSRVSELVIVDDGSTDLSEDIIRDLRAHVAAHQVRFIVKRLEENSGRFIARLRGVEEARGDTVFFLDARIKLPLNFGKVLAQLMAQTSYLVAMVDVEETGSPYALYWDRSHKALFRNHYRDAHGPIVLDYQNYDRYLKGTGAFVCKRAVFLDACSNVPDGVLLSDDVFLMKEIAKVHPITIHPALRVFWRPRERFWPFVARLFERGPGTVEYHVFARNGLFRWIILFGAAASLAWVVLLFLKTKLALFIAVAGLASIMLSTLLIGRGLRESIKLAPIHTASVLAYGLGVLRGLVTNTLRAFKRCHSKPVHV